MLQAPPYKDLPRYPITGGTILLAIGVSLASFAKWIDITPLIENGEIRRGELWRLLTSILPHANLMHLAFNLYWTWVFGTLIEKVFGHFSTLAIFVLLAIVSGGAEYALLSGGIGLSGVGYGLFGMLWVLSNRDRRFTNAVDVKTIQLFVVWFFLCILSTVMNWYPIANVAHGVGCLTGALVGWTISSSSMRRLAGIGSVVVLIALSLAGATIARPWVNLCKYAGGDTAKNAGADEARLGYDALMADRNAEAVRWYTDATRMNPIDADDWYNLGIAFDRVSRHRESVAAYKRAADLAPGDQQYQSALDQTQ